jgi:hypothetical protein
MDDSRYRVKIEGVGVLLEVGLEASAAYDLMARAVALASGDAGQSETLSSGAALASREKIPFLPLDLTYCGKIVAALDRAATAGGISSLDQTGLRASFRSAGWKEPKNWARDLRLGKERGYVAQSGDRFLLTEKGRLEAHGGFRSLRAPGRAAGISAEGYAVAR